MVLDIKWLIGVGKFFCLLIAICLVIQLLVMVYEPEKPAICKENYQVTKMSILNSQEELGVFGYRVSEIIDKDLIRLCYIHYIDSEYNSFCELYNTTDDTITKIDEE